MTHGPARTHQPAHQPWAAQHRQGVLLPVLGFVGLGLAGLLTLGVLIASVGFAGVLVGTLAAVLPVVVVVATFLWVDRWEPEPPRLLLAAFLWGATVSVLGALLFNTTATIVGRILLGAGGGSFVGAVISAPIVEEAFKGAFLLGLLLWRRREFDGLVDGIVYAGLVGAGFAFTENILYIARAFAGTGLGNAGLGLAIVFVLRGVLSPFAHPLFTSMIGLGVGKAARTRSTAAAVLLPLVGYLAAVLLHGLWNASAGSGALLLVYPLIMFPLFVGMVVLVLWRRRREHRVLIAQLPGFSTAGWIAPSEVSLLASLSGRSGWRAAVRRTAGDEAARALRDYQIAVTELAFLQDRIARGTIGPEAARWQQETLDALVSARTRVVNAPNALSAAWRGPPPPGWAPPAS